MRTFDNICPYNNSYYTSCKGIMSGHTRNRLSAFKVTNAKWSVMVKRTEVSVGVMPSNQQASIHCLTNRIRHLRNDQALLSLHGRYLPCFI